MVTMNDVSEYGVMAKGKNEFLAHCDAKKLTFRQICLAKCYECMAGYTDGKIDCKIEGCPIYPKMPYRGKN